MQSVSLYCPLCRLQDCESFIPLTRQDRAGQLVCAKAENHIFPIVGSIPWLFVDPQVQISYWQENSDVYFRACDATIAQIRKSLNSGSVLESQGRRLRQQLQAWIEHLSHVRHLLKPLCSRRLDGAQIDWSRAQLHKPLATQHLGAYQDLLHRDWGWEDQKENDQALDLIKSLWTSETPPEALLVLGTGSSRLAYDLICAWRPQRNLLVDINPMLLFSAQKLFDGEEVTAYEFPVAPLNSAAFAYRRVLKAPQKIPIDTEFLFADAGELVVKPGEYQVVLTPWLLDIISHDLQEFACIVNAMLDIGSFWLNFGTFNFNHPHIERRYSLEEFREIVSQAGFELEAESIEAIPYLQSPLSAHHRIETVYAFRARKVQECLPAKKSSVWPAWYLNHDEPVFMDPSWQQSAIAHSIYAEVLGWVDGKSSILQLAAKLELSRKLPRQEGRYVIAKFLQNLLNQKGP